MSDVGVVVSLDDQQVEQSKVVLDYTSRDYAAIRTQLIGLAKGFLPEWDTAGEAADFGTLILELFAYMGDVIHFYIDRNASEAFLGTAVRRQSVLYIADMMGYVPVGQQCASVGLSFSLSADDPNAPGTIIPVDIPAGTRVYNSSADADTVVIFELDGNVHLNPGDTDVSAYATEGITISGVDMGASLGMPNTEFVIKDTGVIYGTVNVYTAEGSNTVQWSYVTHLADARPTQAVFTTFMDDQGLTHVVFGDNSAGRIPPVNAEMYVGYRYGVGAEANGLAPNTIDTVAPVPNVDLYAVSVTNPASPVGGSDPETIDSMRYSVSRGGSVIKDRAVTLNDFADLAMQVPGVSKSVAYGTVYTAVHVRVAPPGGQGDDPYMARLCTAVEAYLADKTMVGSTVYAEPTGTNATDSLFQDVFIQVTVHVLTAYNRTSVAAQVESVVRSVMAFDSVDFGYRVSIGLIYRTVLAVQGVEWADVTWLSTTTPASPPVGTNVTNIQTNELLIPRIDTTQVVESVTNYPTFTDDELTHDGLWVIADGGAANT